MMHIFPLPCTFVKNENTLLVSGKETCKTTLLFQAALSIAQPGEQVIYIRPERLTRIPPQVSDMPLVTPSTTQHIRFVYLCNVSDFINYLSHFHINPTLPGALLIDDMDFYAEQLAKEGSMEQSLAKLLALSVDAAYFSSSKRSRPCQLIITANNSEEGQLYQRLSKVMFLQYWHILPVEQEDDTVSYIVKNHASESQTIHFHIKDQVILDKVASPLCNRC